MLVAVIAIVNADGDSLLQADNVVTAVSTNKAAAHVVRVIVMIGVPFVEVMHRNRGGAAEPASSASCGSRSVCRRSR